MGKSFCHIALIAILVLCPVAALAAGQAPMGNLGSAGNQALAGLHSFKTMQLAMLDAVSYQPGFATLEASAGMTHLGEALSGISEEKWPPRHSRQWWNSRALTSPLRGLDGRLDILALNLRSYDLEKPGLADIKEWDDLLEGRGPLKISQSSKADYTLRAGRFSAKLLAARDVDGPQSLMSSLAPAGDPKSFAWHDDPAADPISPQSSGYMALQMGSGPLGLTIGGGYSRTELAALGGDDSAGTRGGMTLSSLQDSSPSSPAGGSPYASVGRWSAFVAVPYQITENLGLSPEFSYYHGDSPQYADDAGNEWVMGLQVRFGF